MGCCEGREKTIFKVSETDATLMLTVSCRVVYQMIAQENKQMCRFIAGTLASIRMN